MRQEIHLPEMGESVQEATIVKWHKQVGDTIKADETLVEVATDKVDSELPSPLSGKIIELKMQVNDIAKVGQVIAIIESQSAPVYQTDSSVQVNLVQTETVKPSSSSKKVAIILPEMGESIQEANIVKWRKSIGEMVKQDEILLEVATDKVDSELPSPNNGKLLEICYGENTVVKIGEIIAYLESSDAIVSQEIPELKASDKSMAKTNRLNVTSESNSTAIVSEKGRFYSPLVKKIALEEQLSTEDLRTIQGSGLNGRVTKDDVFAFLKSRASIAPVMPNSASVNQGSTPQKIEPVIVNYDPAKVDIVPMSTMRKSIAKHMVQSIYTAPHVFSVHEVNMKKIWDYREKEKNSFKKQNGFNLTFTHIIMYQVVKALQKFPRMNASIQSESIIIYKDINLGMAVGYTAKDGDNGLIVPVIKESQLLNLVGFAKKANDFTEAARNSTLHIDHTKGGTFTVTNVGVFGTEFGLGIINQPQVGILACGAIVKKAVVTADDAIAIQPTMKIALSYDHRVVDGMLAGQFLQYLQSLLEDFNP